MTVTERVMSQVSENRTSLILWKEEQKRPILAMRGPFFEAAVP
jgi:hypothetical protein